MSEAQRNQATRLPARGELYRCETVVFADNDPKDERPVVVVREPVHLSDMMTVIQRTRTRFDLPGLDDPARPDLGLVVGKWIWGWQRGLRAHEFLAAHPELLGRLLEADLEALIEAWEQQ